MPPSNSFPDYGLTPEERREALWDLTRELVGKELDVQEAQSAVGTPVQIRVENVHGDDVSAESAVAADSPLLPAERVSQIAGRVRSALGLGGRPSVHFAGVDSGGGPGAEGTAAAAAGAAGAAAAGGTSMMPPTRPSGRKPSTP